MWAYKMTNDKMTTLFPLDDLAMVAKLNLEHWRMQIHKFNKEIEYEHWTEHLWNAVTLKTLKQQFKQETKVS